MTTVLNEEPYLGEYRDLGINLATDLEKQKKEIALYLEKLFSLQLSQEEETPLNPILALHLDELMKLEIAHALLNFDSENIARLEEKVPFVKEARKLITTVKDRLQKVEIPEDIFSKLDIDVNNLQQFNLINSIDRYSSEEQSTLVKRNLSGKIDPRFITGEYQQLALLLLCNLPKLYLEANHNDPKPNADLLKRINFISRHILLHDAPSILDQVAMVYYYIRVSEANIDSNELLSTETKESLNRICEGVIFALIDALSKSDYMDFTLMKSSNALQKLKDKVLSLCLDEKLAVRERSFQRFEFDQIKQQGYAHSFFSSQTGGSRLAEVQSLFPIVENLISNQWMKNPELINEPDDTVIQRIKDSSQVFVPIRVANQSFKISALEKIIELLKGAGRSNLFLSNEDAMSIFKGLNRYAGRFDKDPQELSLEILKEFLFVSRAGDLKDFLQLDSNDIDDDYYFHVMREVANLFKSAKIQIKEPTEISNELKAKPKSSAYLTSILPGKTRESNLILIVDGDKLTTNPLRNGAAKIKIEKLMSMIAYSLVQKPPRTISSPIVVNDLCGPALLEAIQDNKFLDSSLLTGSTANKLLVTICGDGGNEHRWQETPSLPGVLV